jgi:putative peptidoglycan lipid II flippase
VNILVNTIFASQESRAVTWLNFAFRLMQFPLGVFGVAIATVAGAGVAQRAAARDLPGVRETLGQGMRLVAFLNVPSAVGLLVLASPIVALIFEHGRFGPEDTAGTAQALAFYAVGLYAYSGVKVLAPAFYALDQARIPLWGSLVGMAANVGLNLALHPVLGFRGVALGTSLAAGANFAVLAVTWKVQQGGFGSARPIRHLARVGAATLVLAAVAWGAHRLLLPLHPGAGLGRQALLALGPIAAGAAAYFGACRLLGIPELGEVWAALRRRREGPDLPVTPGGGPAPRDPSAPRR